MRWLASGWALSWIASYGSGSPLEITSSGCTALAEKTCFPNYASGFNGSARIHVGGHGVTPKNTGSIQFINPAAFSTPTATQVGNVSRTALYNLFEPGGYDIDAGIRRTFFITRRTKFIFSAEAFNVTNTLTFGAPNTNV